MNESRQLLIDLLNTASPTGFEADGQRTWAKYVGAFSDEVDNDAYGNTWATLRPRRDSAHRLMIAAHADEIGMMVNHISDQGYIYVTRIGGSDRAVARARRVKIFGDKGQVPGVVGNTAIHLRDSKDEKAPEWHELFIDVGAANAGEVAELGIRVGHPMVIDEPVVQLANDRLVARAIDNRVSGYIVARVLEQLSTRRDELDALVIGVNAVQEEIGGNGARMVSYRLRPTVALVLDVTHATDSPGISHEKHGRVTLGGGPTVSHGTANHPLVVQRLVSVAERLGMHIQHEASSRSTGTDADDVFVSRSGVPSALVSVPLRYMHSTVELVSMHDVERCIELVTEFAAELKDGDSFVPRIGRRQA